jgi:hypothetical protein
MIWSTTYSPQEGAEGGNHLRRNHVASIEKSRRIEIGRSKTNDYTILQRGKM